MLTFNGNCLLACLLASLATACASDELTKPTRELAAMQLIDSRTPAGFPLGSVVELSPSENRLTEPRAQLGKRLFFDPRLSRTQDVSCSTCHEQAFAFAQPDRVSTGVESLQGTRNA